MTTFSALGVASFLRKALEENNIHTPTDIQAKAIPFLLQDGGDLIAQAQTGTGKTAAFGLPLLQKVNPANPQIQALVLSPTRELCQQINKQLFRFTKYAGTKIFSEAVYGGAYIGDQIKALQRPTQVLVATPGRLVDLLEKGAVDITDVRTVVLDEADEMLSMGFKKELDRILSNTGQKNTWLFSATMSPGIKDIIGKYMQHDAKKIQIDKNHVVNKNIRHYYVRCDDTSKLHKLTEFLRDQHDSRGVIFCKTKKAASDLAKQLIAKNHATAAIHGDLQQRDRDKVMRAFKNQSLKVLVATDLAARGIDVENLAYVVHYQLPDQTDYYTHRSGRTARAGNKGLSLAFVNPKELKSLKHIAGELSISIEEA